MAINVPAIADRLLAGSKTDGREKGPGLVVWLTGLSGAGKSTVAGLLAARFRSAGRPLVVLDGDQLRALLDRETGHGLESRLELALTYAALCREVASRGVNVICATISLFHRVHAWNRDNIPGYVEVYLRVPIDELRRRDPKGLYARADAGLVSDMVGIHLPAEEPKEPDLVIDHAPETTAEAAASRVWALLTQASDRSENCDGLKHDLSLEGRT